MIGRSKGGLTGQLKEQLIKQALERRVRRADKDNTAPAAGIAPASEIPECFYRFDQHPGYQQLRIIKEGAQRLGIPNPFFRAHQGTAGSTTRIAERDYLNYASYNYLGLSGHPAWQ